MDNSDVQLLDKIYLSDATDLVMSTQVGSLQSDQPLNSMSSGSGLFLGFQFFDQSGGNVLFSIIDKCGHTGD